MSCVCAAGEVRVAGGVNGGWDEAGAVEREDGSKQTVWSGVARASIRHDAGRSGGVCWRQRAAGTTMWQSWWHTHRGGRGGTGREQTSAGDGRDVATLQHYYRSYSANYSQNLLLRTMY